MAQRTRSGLNLAVWMVGAAALSASAWAAPSPSCVPAQAAAAAAVSRLAGDWQSSPRVTLPGSPASVPFEAADLGIASPATKLDRMLLLLDPGAAKRAALDAELQTLQNSGSCGFHQWLTASQYADGYANSAADVAAVAAWLRSAGFTVAPLPAGRGWIEFSGTAAQVEEAFGTPVHLFATAAGTRLAIEDAIAVPAAVAPLIRGLVSLDGSVAAAAMTTPEPVAGAMADLAAQTDPAHAAALTPAMVLKQTSIDTPQAAGTNGGGERIAIAARSDVNAADVAAFRSAFGLTASAVSVKPAGNDPGLTQDQAVATAMAEWAGAAAPGAQVAVTPAATTAATDGVDLSLAAIVDQKLADAVAVGYTACEPALSAAHRAFYAELYRQAAAEGMSVIAASGDSGAAACHAAGSDAAVSTGYAVNGLASTSWNTAVGVAGLDGNGGLAAWTSGAYSGGGGVSAAYKLPAWQPAMASNSSGRMLPDVALPTAAESGANPGLVFCLGGGGNGCTAVRGGGSALAAAVLSGVAALLNEKSGADQGNLAPGLYALRSRAGVFSDVQQGSAKLACAAGSPGCDAAGQIGYDAASGYDLATGLGGVDASKLLSAWASPDAAGTGAVTVTLTVTPTVANATYNPTAQITFTASISSTTGGPTPTGTVQFFDQTTSANLGSAVAVGSNGNASVQMTSGLALGGNNVVAMYSGDSNYAALTSSAVTVTTQASSTSMALSTSTTAPTVGQSITATATLTAGTPAAGTVAPTGKVTLNLDGTANTTATLATSGTATTATFTLSIPTGGSHTLQAIYAGDPNYSASTSTPLSLTVAKGATVTTLTATPTALTTGTPETLTATVAPQTPSGSTYTITGTVSFYDGTTLLGTQALTSNTATLPNVTLSTTTTHSITAVYSGDTNWATSTSTAVTLAAVLLNDAVTLTASPANPGPGQAVTLTATVTPSAPPAATAEQNPTGTVVFYNGTTAIGAAVLTPSLNDASVATLISANLPGGQAVLTAQYAGDTTYEPGTSNTVAIDVEDFSLTASPTNPPTNLNIVKGQAGTAAYVVAGLGGFNGQVQVVCSTPTQADMTCTPSPQQVTPTANLTFTLQTFTTGGPAAAMNHAPQWPKAAGGTALAALFFLMLPGRKRRRLLTERAQKVLLLALLLTGLCGVGLGCQSISGTLPGADGTPLGVSTVTITATAYVNNAVVSHSAYLTVNVIPPS